MAGRRRSKSGNSADLVISVLILFVIGWIITNIKLVLFLLTIIGVAFGIYFVIKWSIKESTKAASRHQSPQRNAVQPNPTQSQIPLDSRCMWELSQWNLGELDSAAWNKVIQARLESIAKVNQQIERQRFDALPVIDTDYLRKLHGMPPKEVTTQITPTLKAQNKTRPASAIKRAKAVSDSTILDEVKKVHVFTTRPSLASSEEISLTNERELEAKLQKLEEKIRG